MIFAVFGFPSGYNYQDVKGSIRKRCNIREFDVSNLVITRDGTKRATVKLQNERQIAELMKLNGLPLGKIPMRVETLSQNQIINSGPMSKAMNPYEEKVIYGQTNVGAHNRPEPWGPNSQWVSNQQVVQQTMPIDYNYQQQKPYSAPYEQIHHQRNAPQQGNMPIMQTQDYQYAHKINHHPDGRQTLRQVEVLPSSMHKAPTYYPPGEQMYQPQQKPMTIMKEHFQGPQQYPTPVVQQPQWQPKGAMDSYGSTHYLDSVKRQNMMQDYRKMETGQYTTEGRPQPIRKKQSPIRVQYSPRGRQGSPRRDSRSSEDSMSPSPMRRYRSPPRGSPKRMEERSQIVPPGRVPRKMSPRRMVHDASPQRRGFRAASPKGPHRIISSMGGNKKMSPERDTRGISPRRIPRDISPRRIPHEMPPRKIPRDSSPKRVQRDVPPQRILREVSPRRISRDSSPRRIIREMSPRRIPRQASPARIPRDVSPRRIPREISPGRALPRPSPGRAPERTQRLMSPKRFPQEMERSIPSSQMGRMPFDNKSRPVQRNQSPGNRRSPQPGIRGERKYSPPQQPDKSNMKYGPKPDKMQLPYSDGSPILNQQSRMYSRNYAPSPPPKEPINPWLPERVKAMYKSPKLEEPIRRVIPSYDPKDRYIPQSEVKKPELKLHKPRSPMRLERSPARDRPRRHSPSPRSPRRSWALEKRNSPSQRDNIPPPPPPTWTNHTIEDYRTNISRKIPVWEAQENPNVQPKRHIEDQFPGQSNRKDNFNDRRDMKQINDDYFEERPTGHRFQGDREVRDFPRRSNAYEDTERGRARNVPDQDKMRVDAERRNSFREEDASYTGEYRRREDDRMIVKKDAPRYYEQQKEAEFSDRPKLDSEHGKRILNDHRDKPVEGDWADKIKEKRTAKSDNPVRKKAVNDISYGIMKKYKKMLPRGLEDKVLEDLKLRISRVLDKFYGLKDVSFLEVKYLEESIGVVVSEHKALKRAIAVTPGIPAKIRKTNAPSLKGSRPIPVSSKKPQFQSHKGILKSRKSVAPVRSVNKQQNKHSERAVAAKKQAPKEVQDSKTKSASKTVTANVKNKGDGTKVEKKAVKNQPSHYELGPLLTKALNVELQKVMIKIWATLPDNPVSPSETYVVDKLRSEISDNIRNVLGLNITKRLLNIHNPLVVLLRFSRAPEGGALRSFIEKYKLISFRRAPSPPNAFAARLRTIEDFDRICNANRIFCGGARITVTPCYKFTKNPVKIKTNFVDDKNTKVSTKTDKGSDKNGEKETEKSMEETQNKEVDQKEVKESVANDAVNKSDSKDIKENVTKNQQDQTPLNTDLDKTKTINKVEDTMNVEKLKNSKPDANNEQEMSDQDILALMSDAIVLDECVGSDED